MCGHKFNVKKLEKLNNPERLELIDLEKIIKTLDLPQNPILVDIGAGTGIFSKSILERIEASSIYAFDISEEMIKWINENREEVKTGKLKASVMEENSVPLEDNKADLAFMITVHHELENGEMLLKDINRILKNTGKILICDWKEGAHNHFIEKSKIVKDLNLSGFNNIREINASERLVCIIGEKFK